MSLDAHSRALTRRFADTLNRLMGDNCPDPTESRLAVAYSGGLDSSVLLFLAVAFCRERKIPLSVFHVHHGLSRNADRWLMHCESVCAAYGVDFVGVRVSVPENSGHGLEASARGERYRALGKLCQEHRCDMILTAHQQDDQAETLLLQMLRGSGVAGMSGMDMCHRAPKLLGIESTLLARPLLGESRACLEECARINGVSFVQDESNFDPRYARNALRHQVMPVLAQISPGYAERIARGAQHAQSAQYLLNQLAQQDWEACGSGQGLDIAAMQQMDGERVNNLLRYWLAKCGARMPSTSRLKEICSQLFNAREDARITVHHEHLSIHRYKNRIYAANGRQELERTDRQQEFVWKGEASVHFPEFGGSLHFEPGQHGIDARRLMQHTLVLQHRRGGERLKLAYNRPTRDIKSHYQSLQIPFWQRLHLPFLYIDNQLIFAAGVGMQCTFCISDETPSISLSWEPDETGMATECEEVRKKRI